MAEPKFYVIDASVIIKWFIHENDSHLALRVRNDFTQKKIRLGIPSYAFAECINVISIKTFDQALFSLSSLFSIHLEEFQLSMKVAFDALKIMKRYPRISFYDGMYHALAKYEGGIFLTADEKYYQKTKTFGHIKLLKNYT